MATGQRGTAKGSAFQATLALSTLGLLHGASDANADIEFCPPGTGPGECGNPETISSLRGLSLDFEIGRLYVVDRLNNRINVFDENGGFIEAFGVAGFGSGQFENPTKIAVDNDPASPSHHDVYVVDEGNFRIQKFSPTGEFIWMVGKGVDKTSGADLCTKASGHICGAGAAGEAEGAFKENISVGVGPGGVLHVLDNLPLVGVEFKHRLQRFKDTGEPMPSQCVLFEGGRAKGIAVGASGEFWVANENPGRGVRKYDSSCAQEGGAIETEIESVEVALDEAGNLFIAQGEGKYRVITARKTSGEFEFLSRFGYDRVPALRPEGLAVHNGPEGGVFFTTPNLGVKRLDYPPAPTTLPSPGPITAPSSVEAPAAKVASTKATLVAEVNPENEATEVHFEYVDEATYLKDIAELGPGHGFDDAKSTPPKSLTKGITLKAVEAQIGCPNPAVEAGEPGNECLIPETKYRFRVVATNEDGPGEGTVEGAFETKPSLELGDTFATDVGTATARLNAEVNPLSIPATGFFEYVDEEAFEEDIEAGGDGFATAIKVPAEGQAPLDFGSGEAFVTRSASIYPLAPGTTYHYRLVAEDPLIEVLGEERVLRTFEPPGAEPCENEAARIGAGALLPDCRAYEMVSPVDKAGGEIRVLASSFLNAPAVLEQSSDSGEKLAYGSARAFGDALSAPYTSQYIARRVAGSEWQTHSINPPRERPLPGGSTGQSDTEFKAFSADLCDGWLTNLADPPLAEGALAGSSNLYRRSDRLCGAEGYETLSPKAEPQGFSADGTHAIFITNTAPAPGGTEGQIQLYESVRGVGTSFVCFLPSGEAVSGACTAGSREGSFRLWGLTGAISSDGERVFWSTPGSGEGKLYVRIGGAETLAVSQAAEEAAGTKASWFWGAAADGSKAVFSTGKFEEDAKAKLYSFEPDKPEGEATSLLAEGVLGVMGMSADANRIYFASGKVLAGGASANKANLYLYEAGEGGASVSFIATLASADLDHAVPKEALERSSRVSPDGEHAAFESIAPLTGYDNKGAGGGATREIYRYDANTKKLICASCNPSGARPAGPASIPRFETPLYAARALSDDGTRFFFASADKLAARDSNGAVDVYQWEEVGAGGCDEASSDFAAAAEGCIELISSGQNREDSRFVDASPSGNDVFFATGASLLPQDPGVFDIYDARVDGGLPIPPPKPPPCEGDACHSPPAAPEAPTPSSSTYVGSPEASAGKPAKKSCPKGKKKAAGKAGKSHCAAKHKRHRKRASR
jgi:hypothetical protein